MVVAGPNADTLAPAASPRARSRSCFSRCRRSSCCFASSAAFRDFGFATSSRRLPAASLSYASTRSLARMLAWKELSDGAVAGAAELLLSAAPAGPVAAGGRPTRALWGACFPPRENSDCERKSSFGLRPPAEDRSGVNMELPLTAPLLPGTTPFRSRLCPLPLGGAGGAPGCRRQGVLLGSAPTDGNLLVSNIMIRCETGTGVPSPGSGGGCTCSSAAAGTGAGSAVGNGSGSGGGTGAGGNTAWGASLALPAPLSGSPGTGEGGGGAKSAEPFQALGAEKSTGVAGDKHSSPTAARVEGIANAAGAAKLRDAGGAGVVAGVSSWRGASS